MVTGLFISIEHIAVRDELRRTDGPHTDTWFSSECRESLFQILHREMNGLDLHFIKITLMIPWRMAGKAWVSKTEINTSRKIIVSAIRLNFLRNFHRRMEEWINSENNRIILQTE